MKLFNKSILALFALALGLTACSDDDEHVAGEQDKADRAGVYFPSANATSIEQDPELTEFTFQIARLNTSGALSVPLKVNTNEENVYTVPATAEFADGEAVANVTVAYNMPEVGKAYELVVEVDDEYVSLYKTYDGGYSYRVSVTRVKWNTLGEGTFYDDFWYGGTTPTLLGNVSIQQRDDNKSVYRVSNPYTNELLSSAGVTLGTYTNYYVFTLDKDDYVSWDSYLPINTFNDNYGAEILGWYPSSLSASLAESDADSYAQRDEEGNILYFVLNPYWYMLDIGGWGCSPLYIGFPDVDLESLAPWSEE